MAYRIFYDDKVLFDPLSDDDIFDASLSRETNAAHYLDFSMPPTHTLYNEVKEREGLITLYSDKKKLFVGYISSIEDDIEGTKTISCNGVLDYLSDTLVRPYSTIEGEQTLKAPTSYDGYFEWLIEQHNTNCLDSGKQFKVGINQAGALDENNYIYRSSTTLPTTASEIEDKILDYGGYLFIRYEEDGYYLDLYSDAHEANTQILDFGVNITKFTRKVSTDDQYTAVRAMGATPEGEDQKPITLESLPDGTTQYNSDIVKRKDVVYSISGVQKYGYKEYNYNNSDITTTDYLLKSAVVTLNKMLSPVLTLDVKAVDLSLFMDNYEHLQVGQAVRCRCKPKNIDEYLLINSINLDLQDPGNTEYILGASYDTLTGQQSSYLKNLNKSINSSIDAVDKIDQTAKDAAKDAEEAKESASKAIIGSSEEFYQSDSPTELSGGKWELTNVWTQGKYTWRRTLNVYGDGTSEYSPSDTGICISGNTGDKGAQGDKGDQGPEGPEGPKGDDGKTSYFHIKYSDIENPTLSSQMKDTPSTYIGTYVDFESVDSTDPSKYTWSRFEGAQGPSGEQGIPGTNGTNGKTSYLHIKYSNDGGKTFTSNSGETPGDYIGQCTDFNVDDPTTVGSYTWSKIKGDKGAQGDKGDQGPEGPEGPKGDHGVNGKMIYGKSDTDSNIATKVISFSDDVETIYTGMTISVEFSKVNTASNVKLQITDKNGVKTEYDVAPNTPYWTPNSGVIFVYNGSAWNIASMPVYTPKTVVGNPDMSDCNVVIDDTSIKFTKAGTANAEFTDSTIELGKNSKNSAIKMRGGSYTIETVSSQSGGITRNNVTGDFKIKSTGTLAKNSILDFGIERNTAAGTTYNKGVLTLSQEDNTSKQVGITLNQNYSNTNSKWNSTSIDITADKVNLPNGVVQGWMFGEANSGTYTQPGGTTYDGALINEYSKNPVSYTKYFSLNSSLNGHSNVYKIIKPGLYYIDYMLDGKATGANVFAIIYLKRNNGSWDEYSSGGIQMTTNDYINAQASAVVYLNANDNICFASYCNASFVKSLNYRNTNAKIIYLNS